MASFTALLLKMLLFLELWTRASISFDDTTQHAVKRKATDEGEANLYGSSPKECRLLDIVGTRLCDKLENIILFSRVYVIKHTRAAWFAVQLLLSLELPY